jgi:hypothetical protein
MQLSRILALSDLDGWYCPGQGQLDALPSCLRAMGPWRKGLQRNPVSRFMADSCVSPSMSS